MRWLRTPLLHFLAAGPPSLVGHGSESADGPGGRDGARRERRLPRYTARRVSSRPPRRGRPRREGRSKRSCWSRGVGSRPRTGTIGACAYWLVEADAGLSDEATDDSDRPLRTGAGARPTGTDLVVRRILVQKDAHLAARTGERPPERRRPQGLLRRSSERVPAAGPRHLLARLPRVVRARQLDAGRTPSTGSSACAARRTVRRGRPPGRLVLRFRARDRRVALAARAALRRRARHGGAACRDTDLDRPRALAIRHAPRLDEAREPGHHRPSQRCGTGCSSAGRTRTGRDAPPSCSATSRGATRCAFESAAWRQRGAS